VHVESQISKHPQQYEPYQENADCQQNPESLPRREFLYGLSPAFKGLFGHRSSALQEWGYEGEQRFAPLMFCSKSSIWTPLASGIVSTWHDTFDERTVLTAAFV